MPGTCRPQWPRGGGATACAPCPACAARARCVHVRGVARGEGEGARSWFEPTGVVPERDGVSGLRTTIPRRRTRAAPPPRHVVFDGARAARVHRLEDAPAWSVHAWIVPTGCDDVHTIRARRAHQRPKDCAIYLRLACAARLGATATKAAEEGGGEGRPAGPQVVWRCRTQVWRLERALAAGDPISREYDYRYLLLDTITRTRAY